MQRSRNKKICVICELECVKQEPWSEAKPCWNLLSLQVMLIIYAIEKLSLLQHK